MDHPPHDDAHAPTAQPASDPGEASTMESTMLDAERQLRTLRLLEESTQAPEDSLAPEQFLRDIPGWDSMGMVMFIGLVKERLAIELSVHDLSQRETVADLCAYVDAAGPTEGDAS